MNSNIDTRAPKLGEIPSVGAFLNSAQVKTAAVTSAGAKDLPVNSFLKLVLVGNMPYRFSGPVALVTIFGQNLGCTLETTPNYCASSCYIITQYSYYNKNIV